MCFATFDNKHTAYLLFCKDVMATNFCWIGYSFGRSHILALAIKVTYGQYLCLVLPPKA